MRKSNPWTLLIGVAIMCVMFGMAIIADTSVKTARKAVENKVLSVKPIDVGQEGRR